MIIDSNNQDQSRKYFKQYLCFSSKTLLDYQFSTQQPESVSQVSFLNSLPKEQLPNFFVDRLTEVQTLYSLCWRQQKIELKQFEQLSRQQVIDLNINQNAQNNGINQQTPGQTPQNIQTKTFKKVISVFCLYLLTVQDKKYYKIIFNKLPQKISICKGFLFALGAKQLAIVEFQSSLKIPDVIPIGKTHIHKLDNEIQVLSIDHIFMSDQVDKSGSEKFIKNSGCYLVCFIPDRGYTIKQYLCKHLPTNQTVGMQIIKKVVNFSMYTLPKIFKKQAAIQKPIAYKTLISNVLGVGFKSKSQFYLIDLTHGKILENTLTKLKDWQLSFQNAQDVIINYRKNKNYSLKFDDCIMITIGQSNNIEIFLFDVKFQQKSLALEKKIQVIKFQKNAMDLQKKSQFQEIQEHVQAQVNKMDEEMSFSIVQLTNSMAIDFQKCVINHNMLINIQARVLKDYVLTFNGIIFFGYKYASTQIPYCSYISYSQPYLENSVLTMEQKIWTEYYRDIMLSKMSKNQQIEEEDEEKPEEHSQPISKMIKQRLLMQNRYQKDFICKIFNKNFDQLIKLLDQNNSELTTFHLQQLFLDWAQQYKFNKFILYKEELMFLRKQNMGYVLQIDKDHFQAEYDELIQNKVNIEVHDIDMRGDGKILQQQENEAFQQLKYRNNFQNEEVNRLQYQNYKRDELMNTQDWFRFDQQNQQIQYSLKSKRRLLKQPKLKNRKQKTYLAWKFSDTAQLFQEISQFNNKKQKPTILTIKLKFMRNKLLKARIHDLIIFYDYILKKSFSSYVELELQQHQNLTGFEREIQYIRIIDFYYKIANNLFIVEQNNIFQQDLISLYINFYQKQNGNIISGDLQFDTWMIINSLLHGLIANSMNQDSQNNRKISVINPTILQQRNDQLNSRNNKFIYFLINQKSQRVQCRFISRMLFYLCKDFSRLFECSHLVKSKTWIKCFLNLPFQKIQKKIQISQLLLNQQWRQIILSLYHDLNPDKKYALPKIQHNSQSQTFTQRQIDQTFQILEDVVLQNLPLFSQTQTNLQMSSGRSSFNQNKNQHSISNLFTNYLFKQMKFQRVLNALDQDNFIVSDYQRQNEGYHNMIIHANKSIHSITKKKIQTDLHHMKIDDDIVEQIFGQFYQNIDLTIYQKNNNQTYRVNPKYPSQIYQTQNHFKVYLDQELETILDLRKNCLKSFNFSKSHQKILELQFAMMRILTFRLNQSFEYMSSHFSNHNAASYYEAQTITELNLPITEKFKYKKICYDYLKQIQRAKQSFKHHYNSLYLTKNQKMEVQSQNYDDSHEEEMEDKLFLETMQETSLLFEIGDILLINQKLSTQWLELLQITFLDLEQNSQNYYRVEERYQNKQATQNQMKKNMFFNYKIESVMYYLVKRVMNDVKKNLLQSNIQSIRNISKFLNKIIQFFTPEQVSRIFNSNDQYRHIYKESDLSRNCNLYLKQHQNLNLRNGFYQTMRGSSRENFRNPNITV